MKPVVPSWFSLSPRQEMRSKIKKGQLRQLKTQMHYYSRGITTIIQGFCRNMFRLLFSLIRPTQVWQNTYTLTQAMFHSLQAEAYFLDSGLFSYDLWSNNFIAFVLGFALLWISGVDRLWVRTEAAGNVSTTLSLPSRTTHRSLFWSDAGNSRNI